MIYFKKFGSIWHCLCKMCAFGEFAMDSIANTSEALVKSHTAKLPFVGCR